MISEDDSSQNTLVINKCLIVNLSSLYFHRQILGEFEVNEMWQRAGRQGIKTWGLWQVIKNRKNLRGREGSLIQPGEGGVNEGWMERVRDRGHEWGERCAVEWRTVFFTAAAAACLHSHDKWVSDYRPVQHPHKLHYNALCSLESV